MRTIPRVASEGPGENRTRPHCHFPTPAHYRKNTFRNNFHKNYKYKIPASLSSYRSLSMTVFSLWAMVSTVQSANCCRIICCTIASVSLSMEAVACMRGNSDAEMHEYSRYCYVHVYCCHSSGNLPHQERESSVAAISPWRCRSATSRRWGIKK